MAEHDSKGSKWVIAAVVVLLGYGAYQWLSGRSEDTPVKRAAAPASASSPPESKPMPVAPPPSPYVGSIPVPNTAPPPTLAPTWQPPVTPVPSYVAPQTAVPQAPPKIEPSIPWIEAPVAARIGEHVVVTVSVDSKSTALNSVLLRLRYDITKLALQSVSAGDFMTQTGVPGNFTSDDNPNGGDVAVSLRADSGQAAAGRGSLAVFDFEAIDEGTAVVELQGFEAHEASGKAVEVVSTTPQTVSIDP